MYLPEFKHSKMEWDGWRAFHVEHEYSMFIQFDTGEFVVCDRRWQPERRHVYRDLHLQIIGTNDDECPRFFIPGSTVPIPKSHLHHDGMQTLLLDHDHKMAVSLDNYFVDDKTPAFSTIPERFLSRSNRNVCVYYQGGKFKPISAGQITRHFPQPLSTTERTHVGELKDACKVWLGMQPNPEALKKQYKLKTAAPPVVEFAYTAFSTLTVEQRVVIAERGFDMIIQEKHPYLTFESTFVSPHPPRKEEDDDD